MTDVWVPHMRRNRPYT